MLMALGLTPQRASEDRHQLIEKGYCHLSGIVSEELIGQIRESADRIAEEASEEHKRRHRSQGTILDVYGFQEMAPLIGLPRAVEVLEEMGFANPRFFSGYIISKQPETAPALFWHQDGINWNDPISYTDTPIQFFLMYYLIDTNRNNGCLRVIPGSHRKRHRLHDLPPAHTDELQQGGHTALEYDLDEVDVPVKAGDLVIGDARLIHSAHPNRSSQRRTVVTLWFCPTYDELSESLKAFFGDKVGTKSKPDNWSDEAWGLVKPILVPYKGKATPQPSNRIPDERLL